MNEVRALIGTAVLVAVILGCSGCGFHEGWKATVSLTPINEVEHEEKLTPQPVFKNRGE